MIINSVNEGYGVVKKAATRTSSLKITFSEIPREPKMWKITLAGSAGNGTLSSSSKYLIALSKVSETSDNMIHNYVDNTSWYSAGRTTNTATYDPVEQTYTITLYNNSYGIFLSSKSYHLLAFI